MKKIFSSIKSSVMLCIAVFAIASCVSDNTDQTVSYSSYYTITGTSPNYVLLEDGGLTVYPTIESVNAITNGKGFGNTKRVFMTCSYDVNKDRTVDAHGKPVIKNAKLLGGQTLTTTNVLNQEEATSKNILANDSIFPVLAFRNAWVANGYLTSIVTGQYSSKGSLAINPSINLYAAPEDIKTNAITFTILYNRHSTKNENPAGTLDFVNCYSLAGINVPGSDSINVTINVNGASPRKFKVGREDF